MTKSTKFAVEDALVWDVYWGVGWAVSGAVYGGVGWAVSDAVHGAVYQAVDRAVGEDRPHPGLQSFLINAKVEV